MVLNATQGGNLVQDVDMAICVGKLARLVLKSFSVLALSSYGWRDLKGVNR